MKKMLAVLAAGVLAAGMCAGFVACGEGGGDSLDAVSIVSDKVTEAEWKDALSVENISDCKVVEKWYDMHETSLGLDTPGLTCTGIIKGNIVNDGKIYESYVYDSKYADVGAKECYAEIIEGELWRYYYNEDGTWEKEFEGGGLDGDSTLGGIAMYFEWLENYYEFSEYNSEAKGYICNDVEGEGNFLLKFKKGKLVALIRDWNEENVRIEVTLSYGEQTVTLPEIK